MKAIELNIEKALYFAEGKFNDNKDAAVEALTKVEKATARAPATTSWAG